MNNSLETVIDTFSEITPTEVAQDINEILLVPLIKGVLKRHMDQLIEDMDFNRNNALLRSGRVIEDVKETLFDKIKSRGIDWDDQGVFAYNYTLATLFELLGGEFHQLQVDGRDSDSHEATDIFVGIYDGRIVTMVVKEADGKLRYIPRGFVAASIIPNAAYTYTVGKIIPFKNVSEYIRVFFVNGYATFKRNDEMAKILGYLKNPTGSFNKLTVPSEDLPDHYKTLGLETTASDDEIKSAFRRLAKEYHPDWHSGDEEAARKFKEINEAHQVLSNPDRKKNYDHNLRAQEKREI